MNLVILNISSVLLLASVVSKFVSTVNGQQIVLSTDNHRHSKSDFFYIPGQGCKSPLVLMEGGHKHNAKGKTNIIMGSECKEQEHKEEHEPEKKIIPIPFPVFKHYHHIQPVQHIPVYQHHQDPLEWIPYTDVNVEHFPHPVEHTVEYNLGHGHIEHPGHNFFPHHLGHAFHEHSHNHIKHNFIDSWLYNLINKL